MFYRLPHGWRLLARIN
jgi:FerI (NUC094) domain